MSPTKTGTSNYLIYAEPFRKPGRKSGGIKDGRADGSRITKSGQDPASRNLKGTDPPKGGLAKGQ